MRDDVATYAEAINFLEQLRPGGPWMPTRIIPDGKPTTITTRVAGNVRRFIRKHDGQKNFYFAVNPTRHDMSKKAAKTDIAKIEYLHADLDPNDTESPEDAKARYLAELDGYPLTPTAVIDSGNGIQVLWKLSTPINLLNLPPPVTNADGGKELSEAPR